MMVVEFLIFLAYDGKLEANSDIERELFASAIDQLKEGFNFIISMDYYFRMLSNMCDFESPM